MSARRAYRRFVDTPAAKIGMLARGSPLGRDLSPAERLCLAISATAPTNLLTLNSKEFGTKEIRSAWSRFHKRLNRRLPRPLVYVAVQACSNGDAGYHMHLLLWDYIHAPTLHGLARSVGFGPPDIQQIGSTVEDKLWTTAYVCGQIQSIFGSEHHQRHQTPRKWSHRFSRTSNKVLKNTNPQLLSALDMAKDRSVSDLELVKLLPRFIST